MIGLAQETEAFIDKWQLTHYNLTMIESFKDRKLKHFYSTGERGKIQPELLDRVEFILGLLDVAEGHTVQMLFRLGIAEPVSHSARRRLTDIMRG